MRRPPPTTHYAAPDAVGHFGWHHCGDTAWYGDSWAVDEYSDTDAAPTMQAPEPEPTRAATTPQVDNADILGHEPPQFTVGPSGTREPKSSTPSIANKVVKPAPKPEPITSRKTRQELGWIAGAAAILLAIIASIGIGAMRSDRETSASAASTTVGTSAAHATTMVTVAPSTTRIAAATTAVAPATPVLPDGIQWPDNFTGQDRAFATQLIQQHVITDIPGDLADLPGLAHATCNGLKDSVASYTRIEGNSLGWQDAKREQVASLTTAGWANGDQLVDLSVQYYCPTVHPETDTSNGSISAGDAIFISGWHDLATKWRMGITPATSIMIKKAHAVCAALQTAPEWEVVQDVDARDAGNNGDYKQEFVALAKESYCPIG